MNNLGRVGIIISVRSNSSRLPRKALLKLMGISTLSFLIRRLKTSIRVDEIILATTSLSQDDELAEIGKKEKIKVYRGSLDNVVERNVLAAEKYGIETVVRITGDCPFVSGELVDFAIESLNQKNFDLYSTKGKFPVGLDVEIYRAFRMRNLHISSVLNDLHREHLTLYYYENFDNFHIYKIHPPAEWKTDKIFTIDNFEDYNSACKIVSHFEDIHTPISSIVAASIN